MTLNVFEVDAGSEILGYEAGRYYYGLMPGEGGSNSRLCQLDTEEWDSLGQSAQRLSGLTDHGPHELLVIGMYNYIYPPVKLETGLPPNIGNMLSKLDSIGSSIIEETPPYDLTSNNCQDFAVKFFVAIQSSLDSLEENLEALQKGHLGGLLRLITFTKKEEDGYLTYDIYDRNGKLFRSLTQGGKTGWHHRRPRRVAYAPGGPNVEGGPFASDANRNEMKDIEGDMNVNIQGDLPQYQGVPAFQYQDALQPPNTDPYGQPLNHFGGAPDYAPQG